MNLLDTLALFGAAALAAPIGLLGLEFLVGGRTLIGVGFLAVAAALVVGHLESLSYSGRPRTTPDGGMPPRRPR